jgi:hypothetical protein
MVCYTELVVVNNVFYTEPDTCESCCVILCRLWLRYGVSCRAIGCESYEPVVVNHGVIYRASGGQILCVMIRQRLWMLVLHAEPVVVNHGLLC